ncbi:TetR/AcrR family transcriptional regulator [Oceanobacillus chungangensis]|uniref:TetR/AcrR family transcriptional regulator n=1 Tax=Oceanobacillus chungangensis TaxID=1229152 RepID=A0A3D8Q430_9BACI|nr:TetR/AcrR family transcriptional regulator [Oceanobacillus chungangensis]RDW22115.1 TetR/AcrR family transcriptional regulator [Oceanobacillus chungangensis]
MKEWIPIPGTSKEILIKVALEEFSIKGYKGVNITELATKANMTTGAVYHHFGSKSKLYGVVRAEMEQRIIDRMEGAASLFDQTDEALKAALITGLDFAVKNSICKLISEEFPDNKEGKIEAYLSNINSNKELPIEIVLISSWRSILKGISCDQVTLEQGKNLIKWIFKRENN